MYQDITTKPIEVASMLHVKHVIEHTVVLNFHVKGSYFQSS